MELTYIGLVQILIGGYIILFGGMRSAILFLALSSILQGSAAIQLPALGGSSIPPGQFALLFLAVRVLAPRGGYLGLLPGAVLDNKWLVLFAFYGVASAFIAPRIFAGAINVFPMAPKGEFGLFDTVPLFPTAQNLTIAVYIIGALLIALISSILSRRSGAGAAFVAAIVVTSWFHVATGVLDLVTRGTPAGEILGLLRNANYTLMENEAHGFIRIIGVLPEASAYAGIGFTLFVANAEMWFRSVRPKATGIVAACLALMLILSTSSAAYVALAGYAIFFVLRAILFQSVAPPGKLLLSGFALAGVTFVIALAQVVVPGLTDAVANLIGEMTLDKQQSLSAQQRMFWALQGWHALFDSYGLGIGPGSFRSSSLATAILGSVGILGTIAFLLYLNSVFDWTRRSSWGVGPTARENLAGALGSAALLSLIPAMMLAPHPAPSAFFSIFAGAAIGFRWRAETLDEHDHTVTGPAIPARYVPVQQKRGYQPQVQNPVKQ
ncbi:hypothetical protein BPTFM16_01559 [Altererythrobacter insulae]|nr:hypothetical protein BPTFM16_01559 [Altererythrobacter insulae]